MAKQLGNYADAFPTSPDVPSMFMSPCNACGCNCTPPMATCWTPPLAASLSNLQSVYKPHTPISMTIWSKFFKFDMCSSYRGHTHVKRDSWSEVNSSIWMTSCKIVRLHPNCCCHCPQAQSLKSLLGQRRSQQAASAGSKSRGTENLWQRMAKSQCFG